MLLEQRYIPWPQTRGAQEDFAPELEGAVESLDLRLGAGVLGGEPVHAVHDLWGSLGQEGRVGGVVVGLRLRGLVSPLRCAR